MPSYETADLGDLITTTQKKKGRLRFTQIATDLQWHEVFGRLLKRERVTLESGEGIQRNVMWDHSDSADVVGMFEDDQVSFKDVMTTFSVPWRHMRTFWLWERREMLMNRGPERIVSLMQARRVASMIALARKIEQLFWSSPPSSSDKKHLFGVPYWITQNDTEGFYGGNHTNFAGGKGGLDADTYTRFKNYTGQYAEISKYDLIRKMRAAHVKCDWRSPIDIRDYRRGNGQRFRIYVPYNVISEIEEVGEKQNENLGRDIASMDGKMVFRGHPIVWVPYLDTSSITNKPVYMLDFNDIEIAVLQGDYLRETKPKESATNHNALVVFVDLTCQILFNNVRTHAVFTTGAQAA